ARRRRRGGRRSAAGRPTRAPRRRRARRTRPRRLPSSRSRGRAGPVRARVRARTRRRRGARASAAGRQPSARTATSSTRARERGSWLESRGRCRPRAAGGVGWRARRLQGYFAPMSHPERIVPDETSPGIVALHLKRYEFAAPLCRDADVLDAGCGVGYGSAFLAASARWVGGGVLGPYAVAYGGGGYGGPE